MMNTTENETLGLLPDEPHEIFQKVEELNKITRILVPVTISALLAIGVLGNVLVILVSIRSKRFQNSYVHTWLVLNIAVADLCYLVVSAPYYIESNVSSKWSFHPIFCPIRNFLTNLSVAAGIATICVLAWMRGYGAQSPMKFQRSFVISTRFGFGVTFGSWLFAALYALPSAIFVQYVHLDLMVGQCEWTNKAAEKTYVFVAFVITYLSPLVVLVWFNVIVRKAIVGMKERNKRRIVSSNAETLMNRTIFALICAFLLLWLPHHLYRIIVISGNYNDTSYVVMHYTLETIGQCTSYAHACINPVIYTFAMPKFRRQLCSDFWVSIVRGGGIPCCIFRKKTQVTKRRNNHARQPVVRAAQTEPVKVNAMKLAESSMEPEGTLIKTAGGRTSTSETWKITHIRFDRMLS